MNFDRAHSTGSREREDLSDSWSELANVREDYDTLDRFEKLGTAFEVLSRAIELNRTAIDYIRTLKTVNPERGRALTQAIVKCDANIRRDQKWVDQMEAQVDAAGGLQAYAEKEVRRSHEYNDHPSKHDASYIARKVSETIAIFEADFRQTESRLSDNVMDMRRILRGIEEEARG